MRPRLALVAAVSGLALFGASLPAPADDASRATKAERTPRIVPDGPRTAPKPGAKELRYVPDDREPPALAQPIISNQAGSTAIPTRSLPAEAPGRRQPQTRPGEVPMFQSQPIPEFKPEPIIRPN